MIDIDLSLAMHDGTRRFDLDVRFASAAPIVALYGPSGAGKSLTLQAMAGLLAPRRGHVRVGGRTLYDSANGIDVPAGERGIGYMFQHYALFPHLSVRQNVAFGLGSWRRRRLSAPAAQRVDALLQSFGLTTLAASRPAALSGGQQQRVALARALACDPGALLLDEPFAALNPMLRQSLRRELADVVARWKIPVVMVSHDIEDVLELADMAFVIEHGEVVREVDLNRAQSRDVVRRGLLPAEPPRTPRPDEDRIRAMLCALDPHG